MRENQQALSSETPSKRVAAFHFVVFPRRNEKKYIVVQESPQREHRLKTLEAFQLKCNVVLNLTLPAIMFFHPSNKDDAFHRK